MNQFFIVPPQRGRRSWDVHGFDARARWIGTWNCDGEDIAKLVQRRLRAGVDPGWAAKDLRMGIRR